MISRKKFKYLRDLYLFNEFISYYGNPIMRLPERLIIKRSDVVNQIDIQTRDNIIKNASWDGVDVIEPTQEQKDYNREMLKSYLFHKA